MNPGAGAVIPSNGVRVSLDQLPVGFTCNLDIYDDQERLLLGRGCPLTENFRQQLIKRGVSSVTIPEESSKQLKAEPRRKSRDQKDKKPGNDQCHQRIERSRENYSAERSEQFLHRSTAAIATVVEIGSLLHSPTVNDVAKLCDVPKEFTDMLIDDSDQSMFSLARACDPLSLADRCAQMTTLAINTAIELELPDRDVVNVGLAALLHDLGLYLMPAKFRDPTSVLTEQESWEYRQHPIKTLETFSDYSLVPDEVRVIIAQVHEKPDGTGYPRGLRNHHLHPSVAIVSLVDSYLTLVRPGPGRPAVIPHDAISLLLFEGNRGRYGAAVMRAFITQMTLFPIGTDVELDNGQRATVLRRDGAHYATPVVRPHNGDPDQMLPLSESPHSIVRPLIDKSTPQMRITPDMMSTLNLDTFER